MFNLLVSLGLLIQKRKLGYHVRVIWINENSFGCYMHEYFNACTTTKVCFLWQAFYFCNYVSEKSFYDAHSKTVIENRLRMCVPHKKLWRVLLKSVGISIEFKSPINTSPRAGSKLTSATSRALELPRPLELPRSQLDLSNFRGGPPSKCIISLSLAASSLSLGRGSA